MSKDDQTSMIAALTWPEHYSKIRRLDWIGVYVSLVLIGSILASVFLHIAFLIVTIAAMLWLTLFMPARATRLFEPTRAQLRERNQFPVELWGDEKRVCLARFFSDLIAQEFEWPNGNFIPDDPFAILLYSPTSDGGEILVIQQKFKDKYKVSLDPVLRTKDVALLKFGDFIDRVLPLLGDKADPK